MCTYKFILFLVFILFSYGNTHEMIITKCCPYNRHVGFRKVCENVTNTNSYNIEVAIYDGNITKMERKVVDAFKLVPSQLRNFHLCEAFDLSRKYNYYLIQDGTVVQELPNAYNRFTRIDNNHFCIDVALPNGRNILEPTVKIWTIPLEEPENNFEADTFFVVTGLIISSIFMILVLIVYMLLPELRNLCGMILMAYVATLLGAFLLLTWLYLLTILELNTDAVCLGFTFLIYYSFLSCFCWMNVMSVDIWWTFRGYAKARPIHRRGETFKFLMYCTYAFGLPLLMTIGMGVIDSVDLTHVPWFIKPDLNGAGCFLEGGGKFVYLYVPMLIIIIMNWVLFLMTAFNIWRLSRGTAVLDSPAAGNPSAHRAHRHRLMLYLKLSVIMGVSWLLEVLSALAPEFRGWYLSDAYNLLMGLFIFLIFVCKKKVFKKLEKRLSTPRTKWSPLSKSRKTSVSSDSSDSQDTTSQVCSSPSGSTYYKA